MSGGDWCGRQGGWDQCRVCVGEVGDGVVESSSDVFCGLGCGLERAVRVGASVFGAERGLV